jgi:hypothetical protein
MQAANIRKLIAAAVEKIEAALSADVWEFGRHGKYFKDIRSSSSAAYCHFQLRSEMKGNQYVQALLQL